ncbi:MAG: aldolase [Vulcanimicrobiaceae bacterium]
MNDTRARRELIVYGRELWERRLVMGSSGNLSVRLDEHRMLITPAGRSLRNLSEDDLVLANADGVALDHLQVPTSELPLHVAAYRVRADINMVVHTHPTFCVVWSKRGTVFARDTVGARETLRTVEFTPFYPAGSKELAEVVGRAFAKGVDNVLMERHGLTCVAASLEEAFLQTDLAEEAARIAYFSQLAEGAPSSVP